MAGNYLNLRSSAATDPIRNFRFLVNFTEVGTNNTSGGQLLGATVGFMTVQGLSVTTEPIPYREGGFNTTVHQLPGQQSFSPVTMQRGVVLGSKQGWDWFRRLYDPGTSADETATTNFRCTVTVKVLNYPTARNRNLQQTATSGPAVAAEFTLMNAWPTTIAYSDLNAADNAVLVEQMILVHEGFQSTIKGDPAAIDALGGITATGL